MLFAFLCVLAYVYAISYKYRRNNISYNPADEICAHLKAADMTIIFTIFSAEYGKMEFATFGFCLLAVMSICYLFAYSKEGEAVT
jgi:hypothetical protein